MDVWEIVGFRRVEGKDKVTGAPFSGYRLYLQRDPASGYVHGIECAAEYISDKYVKYEPVVGEVVQLFFNRYNKICDVRPV